MVELKHLPVPGAPKSMPHWARWEVTGLKSITNKPPTPPPFGIYHHNDYAKRYKNRYLGHSLYCQLQNSGRGASALR